MKKFENFEVIAFNIEVFRSIKVYTLFTTWPKSVCCRGIGSENGFTLARPSELITLSSTIYNFSRNLLKKDFLINGTNNLAFLINYLCDNVRK